MTGFSFQYVNMTKDRDIIKGIENGANVHDTFLNEANKMKKLGDNSKIILDEYLKASTEERALMDTFCTLISGWSMATLINKTI